MGRNKTTYYRCYAINHGSSMSVSVIVIFYTKGKNRMSLLSERKRELELKEINKHLENESKLNKTVEQISEKLRYVRKLFPEAPLQIHHNPYNNRLVIKEYSLIDTNHYYTHQIDFDNVKESLAIFDNILNNPDKYRKRHELIVKTFKRLGMNEAYLISGTFVHSSEKVLQYGSVLEELFIRGMFDDENKLTLKTKITYEQIETLSDEYDIELNGFDFTVNILLDDTDSLDFTNRYACTIENVEIDKILRIIDTLKETTRKDSIVVNFNN